MKYSKKFIVEAISFDELVQHGTKECDCTHGDMPWRFSYEGQPITHETDTCYLIPSRYGTMRMTPKTMLITSEAGTLHLCDKKTFDTEYEKVDI